MESRTWCEIIEIRDDGRIHTHSWTVYKDGREVIVCNLFENECNTRGVKHGSES